MNNFLSTKMIDFLIHRNDKFSDWDWVSIRYDRIVGKFSLWLYMSVWWHGTHTLYALFPTCTHKNMSDTYIKHHSVSSWPSRGHTTHCVICGHNIETCFYDDDELESQFYFQVVPLTFQWTKYGFKVNTLIKYASQIIMFMIV